MIKNVIIIYLLTVDENLWFVFISLIAFIIEIYKN
jgi:hypothetical protein